MDESKENEDQNENINSEKPYRNSEHKATNLPGMQAYMYTEFADTGSLNKSEEVINVQDLKFVVHCYSIQYLIIGKLFALVVFSIGIYDLKFISTIPLSLLDIIGYIGSLRLSYALNYAFILYLTLSIITRLILSLYSYSLTSSDTLCYTHMIFYSYQACDSHLKFTIGSLLIAILEIFQIILTLMLILRLKTIPKRKKDEMFYVLRSKVVPRLICCGKLKNWKLIFE